MSIGKDAEAQWRAFCIKAREHEARGHVDAAWACLEAAHIVGQRVTRLHATTHLSMLGLAWRTRDTRELFGQSTRLLASIVVTWIWVPIGNTGRANISALKSAPVPRDLEQDRDQSHD
jgi:hypothetical protein